MAKSKFEEVLQGVGSAIGDIRHKLVDEAFFSRPPLDAIAPMDTPTATAPTLADYAKEAMRQQPAEQDERRQEQDIER